MKNKKGVYAWQVPNSNLLITINEAYSYFQKSSEYRVAIMFTKDNTSICSISGNDKYDAIEKLLGKVNDFSETWWTIFTQLNPNAEIVEINDWWNLPVPSDNIDKEAIKALIQIDNSENKNIKVVYLRSKEKNRYCASILFNDKIIFKAIPHNEKDIAFSNLKMTILGIGANLEKIQNGAWNALIDTENHEYEIKTDRFYEKIIEKVENNG